jgi:hypothetical protein
MHPIIAVAAPVICGLALPQIGALLALLEENLCDLLHYPA